MDDYERTYLFERENRSPTMDDYERMYLFERGNRSPTAMNDSSDCERMSLLKRVSFLELTRKNAEAVYANNPSDAENLTKWGDSLLDLSQFEIGYRGFMMVEDAISKMEESLKLIPSNHYTLWRLGKAYTLAGFTTHNLDIAYTYFDKATYSFKKAVAEDPGNELYAKSLEISAKAPLFHQEQKLLSGQQVFAGGSSAPNMRPMRVNGYYNSERLSVYLAINHMNQLLSGCKLPAAKKKSKKSNLTCGILAAVGIVALMGMIRYIPPPAPSK